MPVRHLRKGLLGALAGLVLLAGCSAREGYVPPRLAEAGAPLPIAGADDWLDGGAMTLGDLAVSPRGADGGFEVGDNAASLAVRCGALPEGLDLRLFGIDPAGLRLACSLDPADGGQPAWLLLGREQGGGLGGALRQGDRRLDIIESDETKHGFGIERRTGFAIFAGRMPVAALVTTGSGQLWLGDGLPAADRLLLAGAAAALMLAPEG